MRITLKKIGDLPKTVVSTPIARIEHICSDYEIGDLKPEIEKGVVRLAKVKHDDKSGIYKFKFHEDVREISFLNRDFTVFSEPLDKEDCAKTDFSDLKGFKVYYDDVQNSITSPSSAYFSIKLPKMKNPQEGSPFSCKIVRKDDNLQLTVNYPVPYISLFLCPKSDNIHSKSIKKRLYMTYIINVSLMKELAKSAPKTWQKLSSKLNLLKANKKRNIIELPSQILEGEYKFDINLNELPGLDVLSNKTIEASHIKFFKPIHTVVKKRNIWQK